MKILKKKYWIYTLAALIIIPLFCIIAGYRMVTINAIGRTYDNICEIPHNKVGLLLATSPITAGGSRNFYFENRIIAAEELYKAGKVDYIIASGGDYRGKEKMGCDEPQAIKDSLIARGVPADRIILDYEGLRTLNSIVKAKEVYGLESVTIISQKYHNERAIYLADKYGLHAVAYNAAPSPIKRNRIKNTLREYLARPKMYLDLIIGSKPKFETEEIIIKEE